MKFEEYWYINWVVDSGIFIVWDSHEYKKYLQKAGLIEK